MLKPFLTRVANPRPLETSYYIGNVIALDLLNLQEEEMSSTTDVEEPVKRDFSILSAGCGNLRNLILTITSLPTQFEGKLRVTLNDIDPFIQARNLLFLFMMIHFSSDPNIASIITTTWYSLHLPEDVYKLLIECLRKLVSISSSQLKEYYHNHVDLTDDDLEIVKQVWAGWLNLDQQAPSWRSVSLSIQRQQRFKDDSRAAVGLESYRTLVPKRHWKSVITWVENGDFLPSGKTAKGRHENPTLSGRTSREAAHGVHMHKTTKASIAEFKKQPKDVEFIYCIQSDLMPFGEWDYLQASSFSNEDSLIVMYHAFITNQTQQFIDFIKAGRLHVSFLLGTCLELTEAEVHGEKFDRIFTSNISDYVGTKVLLKAMKPLLNTENKNAVIVTQHWNWFCFVEESKADYPLYMLDGSWQKWIAAAQRDTGKDHKIRPRHWYQEYFNNTSYFVDYLRADLMASNCILKEVADTKGKIETFQQVKQQCSGLRMRDFRKGLNKVVPWRYRCNARPVNMLPGLSRMVEWYIA